MTARFRWVASAVTLAILVTVTACGSSEPSAIAVSTTAASPEAAAASSSPAPTPTTTKSSAVSTSPPPKLPEIMPDFVGGTVAEAEAVLKPLNVRIKTVNQISQQPAGNIIEQDPVAGADFVQAVTLTVSAAPAVVPDVTQKTFSTAESTLTGLGFTVKENAVFDEKLADGLVVAQDPPAGATNASEVTLNVVRRPVVSYLGDMSVVTKANLYDPQPGTQKANGKTYSHGILITPGNSSIGSVEYDLSRQYRQLTGELGLDDKSSSSAVGKVEIYGDGRLLTQVDVPFGVTVPVDVDVANVLRLKINISVVEGKGAVVFGDFKVQGVQSEISASPTATTTR